MYQLGQCGLDDVLRGLDRALALDFERIKINAMQKVWKDMIKEDQKWQKELKKELAKKK